jgi:hypothetical protein
MTDVDVHTYNDLAPGFRYVAWNPRRNTLTESDQMKNCLLSQWVTVMS